MKDKTILDITVRVCFLLLILALVTIFVRFLTRQILVEKLGWDNAFTKTIFWGDEFMGDSPDDLDENREILVDVDWASKYPFSNSVQRVKNVNDYAALRKYTLMLDTIETKIDRYASSLFLGHMQLTKLGKKYNSLIGCAEMPMDAGETIIRMDNGYLTDTEPAVPDKDLEILADQAASFSKNLEKQGIYFVYANAGSKVCPSDKQLPPGVVENTNENADRLIRLLEEKNVNVLDYRPLQEAEFPNWYDSYYITDHHWKNSTSLWAAGVLAEHLNAHADFDFNLKYFDREMYSFETMNDYFIGGQGRALTTAISSLEPFDKILPEFKTDFSIQIPTRGVDERGTYSQTLFREEAYDAIKDYSMRDFETKEDAYNSVMWRNDALGMVQNHLAKDNRGKRLLMIQDSFGWYLSTFLAADIPSIDFLNLNAFDGSLESYIEESKPDAVVLLLCERNIKAIDDESYAAHTHFFDFR